MSKLAYIIGIATFFIAASNARAGVIFVTSHRAADVIEAKVTSPGEDLPNVPVFETRDGGDALASSTCSSGSSATYFVSADKPVSPVDGLVAWLSPGGNLRFPEPELRILLRPA